MPEFSGKIDGPTLKAASGGDRLSMRRIRREDESLEVTAHVWIFGNENDDEDGPRLGICKDDPDGQAIKDRAKLLRRDRIDPQIQDLTVVRLDSKEFQQAALARLVEYCKAFGKSKFPEDLPSMREWLQEQAQGEMPAWKREWLPHVLKPTPSDGEDSTNVDVYASYQGWHASEGDGPPVSRAVVGKTDCGFYGIAPGKQVRGMFGPARPYPGYVLADTDSTYWGDGVTVIMPPQPNGANPAHK